MQSGKLLLDGGYVRYSLDDSAQWELPISSIRVIGEATNQNGPFLDDYFLCFAVGPDCWYEASFYAEGREQFLISLASRLGHPLVLRLVCSADFDSSVLWPPHLAGRPMFSFTPVQPTTWLGRLIGPLRNRQTFSTEVLAEFGSETATDRGGTL